MGRLLIVGCCWAGMLLTQTAGRFQGVVVDGAGQPLANAWVEHTGKPRMTSSTDGQGRFSIQSDAPAVVIRKAGYRSVRLMAGGPARVVLELLPSDGESRRRCTVPADVQVSETQGDDVDYQSKFYRVESSTESGTLLCGRGPTWSKGVPSDQDVWESATYDEEASGTEEFVLGVDTRGTKKDGTYWRYRGSLGESCRYSGKGARVRQALECLMERTW